MHTMCQCRRDGATGAGIGASLGYALYPPDEWQGGYGRRKSVDIMQARFVLCPLCGRYGEAVGSSCSFVTARHCRSVRIGIHLWQWQAPLPSV